MLDPYACSESRVDTIRPLSTSHVASSWVPMSTFGGGWQLVRAVLTSSAASTTETTRIHVIMGGNRLPSRDGIVRSSRRRSGDRE